MSRKINKMRILSKKERLEALINHYADGNKADFARKIGISPQGLSTWLARNSFDVDILYSNCESISAEWLLAGHGQMIKQDNPQVVGEPQSATHGKSNYEEKFFELLDEIVRLNNEIRTLNNEIRELRKENERLNGSSTVDSA